MTRDKYVVTSTSMTSVSHVAGESRRQLGLRYRGDAPCRAGEPRRVHRDAPLRPARRGRASRGTLTTFIHDGDEMLQAHHTWPYLSYFVIDVWAGALERCDGWA